MNLIEKWKNRETKKKLKQENFRLKEQLKFNAKSTSNIVLSESRKIQELRVSYELQPGDEIDENIRRSAEQGLLLQLLPYIEHEISDDGCLGGKHYVAKVFVASIGNKL